MINPFQFDMQGKIFGCPDSTFSFFLCVSIVGYVVGWHESLVIDDLAFASFTVVVVASILVQEFQKTTLIY